MLVHGALDRASSFGRVVRRLGGLTVVTYDRRGYQHSRRAAVATDGTLRSHVADLLALVGDGPDVVVGHSYGGTVALTAAAESRAIRAVGAFEPPLQWLEWWPRRQTAAEVRAQDPADFAEAFFRRVAGSRSWDRLSARGRTERRSDGPALAAELAELAEMPPPFDPADLDIPVVLGRGEHSYERHRRGVAELAEDLPHAEVFEIKGARHGAHLLNPGAFARFVARAVELAQ